MDVKTCNKCQKSLPVSAFHKAVKDGKTYFRNTCAACRNAVKAKYASNSPQNYLKVLYIQLKSQRKKQKNVEFCLDFEHIIALWEKQNGRCALSGVVMTYHRDGIYGAGKKDFNASIDRINPAGPYKEGNIQLVATRVNIMKHTLSPDMLIWWIRALYEHAYLCKT